ncbi:unnamed protein product [Rotaria magnacalcarata]|uniref:Uncharacterized protein n=1 Tax=Rotaria magnacalcarata TaxID=392030 RepID=A0A815WWX9_9BILA|nr:unnamed protein product [Rotaria magnacalcarata]CAF1550854.1 unnamed protein product [Rotaria magnacalcarata]CAF1912312.1 unnamed protein product [Rotaria magnacalcarata]CAF3865033.1 unnamed protein product [Rotaria magnacalcarata]CAF3877386.1 unnamed protein product [Rotaria magnacalcarata]
MSSAIRRPTPTPRPYGIRPTPYGGARAYGGTRPYSSVRPYGSVRPYRSVRPPPPGAGGLGGGSAALSGALGALGGTLGCLLCLAAIGALGLFACCIALAAYAKKFLNAYKQAELISGADGQIQIGFMLLFASLFYTIVCRIQRS